MVIVWRAGWSHLQVESQTDIGRDARWSRLQTGSRRGHSGQSEIVVMRIQLQKGRADMDWHQIDVRLSEVLQRWHARICTHGRWYAGCAILQTQDSRKMSVHAVGRVRLPGAGTDCVRRETQRAAPVDSAEASTGSASSEATVILSRSPGTNTSVEVAVTPRGMPVIVDWKAAPKP